MYHQQIEQIERSVEFSQLKHSIYLDHAASTIPCATLLNKFHHDLTQHLYSNPHSHNPSSSYTTEKIHTIRCRVLQELFHTCLEEYDLVFTSNATQALKLVGELFPFSSNSIFAYLQSSHNSVLGIREFALQRGGDFVCLEEVNQIHQIAKSSSSEYNLFAYSPECNHSGIKCELITVPQSNWYTLLDASKYCSTNQLDLSNSNCKPDFIALSFYKIFGFPNLGALLLKRNRGEILLKQKKYFSGGTLKMSSAMESFHVFRDEFPHEQLEDGTLPFYDILALPHAMDAMKQVFGYSSMQQIQQHTFYLAQYTSKALATLTHANGTPVCELYGNWTKESCTSELQGSIVNFNLKDDQQQYIGYSEVEAIANLEHICLRTGCFCNPGACMNALQISKEQWRKNYETNGHICSDSKSILDGKPTGSIRISFGYLSTLQDAKQLIAFVKKYFVSDSIPTVTLSAKKQITFVSQFSQLWIYPIKSCEGIKIDDKWKFVPQGLLYDREWSIIESSTGKALTQKTVPKMSSIQPTIDLQNQKLILYCKVNHSYLSIDLNYFPASKVNGQEQSHRCISVCGSKTQGVVYEEESIHQWISNALGIDCKLVRKEPSLQRVMRNRPTQSMNYSNEAPFLLLLRSSLDWLNEKLKRKYVSQGIDYSYGTQYKNSDWLIARFRPNLVLEDSIESSTLLEKYDYIQFEQSIETIQLLLSTVSNNTEEQKNRMIRLKNVGPCNRCSMICVDKQTMEKVEEPLKTLYECRKDAKVVFGILLAYESMEEDQFSEIEIAKHKVIVK